MSHASRAAALCRRRLLVRHRWTRACQALNWPDIESVSIEDVGGDSRCRHPSTGIDLPATYGTGEDQGTTAVAASTRNGCSRKARQRDACRCSIDFLPHRH